MKIKDVKDRLKEWSDKDLMPEGQVIRLINDLEKQICNDLLSRRETGIEYIEHKSVSEECILPSEYGEMYVHYILSAVYTRRYETERAAVHTAAFNNIYKSYGNYVTRAYPPKPCARIRG